MERRTFIGAGVALVAVGGGAYYLTRPGQSVGPALGSANAQEAGDLDLSSIPDIVYGDENAPVTMVEYASFTCPHCATFHENVFGQLKADYIDTGKVRFIYREVYFDRFGLWAAMVARCGGEARYSGIADMIFAEQRDWLSAETPAAIADNLRSIGKRAGIPADEVDACLQDADKAQVMVARYQVQSEEDGITATPSFIIDGESYSNMSYSDLQAVLDEKLGS